MKYFALSFVFVALTLCSCRQNKPAESADTTMETAERIDSVQAPEVPEPIDTTSTTEAAITADMAYQGVNNYCHGRYDWSMAEENPSIMYVKMGEETETEYQVVFRSYTGAFVYFYVDKSSGTTRMIEYVPSLDVKSEAGTIELSDYLKEDKTSN